MRITCLVKCCDHHIASGGYDQLAEMVGAKIVHYSAGWTRAYQMRITCLLKRWDHHTASGGYDQLAEMVGAKIVQRIRRDGLGFRIAQKIWVKQNKAHEYLLDYRFGDWLAEVKFLATGLWRPPHVLHVLYGDEQLNLLLRWRDPLLPTGCHVPPAGGPSGFPIRDGPTRNWEQD